MRYADGASLFKKNASEWAMAIFYESANSAYGFMERFMYNFLTSKDVQREDKEFMYMPENEFLDRVLSGNSIVDFSKVYQDCLNTSPERMPWLEKIRYKGVLTKQLDLDPRSCKTVIDVHKKRKALVTRWFQAFTPYLENYELARESFYPGVISSAASKLNKSASLLVKRDAELGLDDLSEVAKTIDRYLNKHG